MVFWMNRLCFDLQCVNIKGRYREEKDCHVVSCYDALNSIWQIHTPGYAKHKLKIVVLKQGDASS